MAHFTARVSRRTGATWNNANVCHKRVVLSRSSLPYTSLADERSVSEMLSAGAAGVIYKEASISALADAIRATHSGLSVLSPRFSKSLAHLPLEESLSDTEVKILRLVSQGLTNEQIAPLVYLSPSTVKYHLARLSTKLGGRNRVTLAVAAVQLGLLERSSPGAT